MGMNLTWSLSVSSFWSHILTHTHTHKVTYTKRKVLRTLAHMVRMLLHNGLVMPGVKHMPAILGWREMETNVRICSVIERPNNGSCSRSGSSDSCGNRTQSLEPGHWWGQRAGYALHWLAMENYSYSCEFALYRPGINTANVPGIKAESAG